VSEAAPAGDDGSRAGSGGSPAAARERRGSPGAPSAARAAAARDGAAVAAPNGASHAGEADGAAGGAGRERGARPSEGGLVRCWLAVGLESGGLEVWAVALARGGAPAFAGAGRRAAWPRVKQRVWGRLALARNVTGAGGVAGMHIVRREQGPAAVQPERRCNALAGSAAA
jgi:hypothetical protein